MSDAKTCSSYSGMYLYCNISWQPLAALEPTKLLTHSFCSLVAARDKDGVCQMILAQHCNSECSRLIHCLLDVSRNDRQRYIRQEEGKAGSSLGWPATGLAAASDRVRCVWASDIVTEQRRNKVVHLGRGTEFERRQGRTQRSDWIRTDLFARN
jgi:hypothetical protein